MIKIDKIPIENFKQDPSNGSYKLGTLVLTAVELANAQKVNDVIDNMIILSERLTKLENK